MKVTWLREMMFRAFLRHDLEAYRRNREAFLSALKEQYPDMPPLLRSGIVAFYDGALHALKERSTLPVGLPRRRMLEQCVSYARYFSSIARMNGAQCSFGSHTVFIGANARSRSHC